MATKHQLNRTDIGLKSPKLYNRIRTTIETAFYKNNVIKITSLEEAYQLAKHSPGTIITDLPVHRADELGLPIDAKVLLFNDGIITGRQAQARRLIDKSNLDHYANIIRDCIYENRDRTMYHATVVIGLHEDFTVRAHLLIPEGFENTMYSWMLNFQVMDEETLMMYKNSHVFDEGDIFLYSDPDIFVDGFEDGLALFDRDHNCAALFGLRYFGEHKKGSLTMAWSIAQRNGFTACHGGQKRFNLKDKSYVMGVFGLSGSGKSTITHSKHNNKYDITVLHDDAFVISNKDASSVSLEPTYFDKVQDYPTDSEDNKYLITMQNTGATLDENGFVVPVTEDIQSGNGRAIKSKFWTPARLYKFDEKVNAIFWIMKDDTLPPLLKVNSSTLASTLGATLATKRSSAEHGADTTKLAMVPYANPFRLYPLSHDFDKFKDLFENHKVECYVINTGHFLDKKIPPKVTLGAIESIVEGSIKFETFTPLKDTAFAVIDGFIPPLSDSKYIDSFNERMHSRIEYLKALDPRDILPDEAYESIESRLNK
ncbi:phosphoenolpyruvate carboxykinase (ATP) [Liberiplasma polymorphum]|uniref:phosphoenolpyruvate carboxykinase (ATP) n=1 Tax=Liberiplasma polymorphum TaxID=3374570 RepID=UPI003772E3D1